MLSDQRMAKIWTTDNIIEYSQGNDFFKKGQFAAAVEHYSASITMDPTNAVLPINRAMALLKLERYSNQHKFMLKTSHGN